MNKVILLFVFLAALTSCGNKQKEINYYDSGEIMSVIIKNKDGEADAQMLTFNKDGTIKELKQFVDGKQVGSRMCFYENGAPKKYSKEIIKDSLCPEITYYKNGVAKNITFYDKDSIFHYSIWYNKKGLQDTIMRGYIVKPTIRDYQINNKYLLTYTLLGPVIDENTTKLAYKTVNMCYKGDSIVYNLDIANKLNLRTWELIYHPKSKCDTIMDIMYICDNDTVLKYISFGIANGSNPSKNWQTN